MRIKVKRIREVELPQYQYPGDSGVDLINAEETFILKPMMRKVVPTGIKVEIPTGYELQIRPRSGLAAKHGITVLNTPGTVDSSYRGEIKVILINLGEKEIEIKKGMRIAQGVLVKVEKIEWKEVKRLRRSKR
ncbi:MAG: dUTP diphosphatase, partial [Caldiserica bacterium]